jgi:hypothetical protein
MGVVRAFPPAPVAYLRWPFFSSCDKTEAASFLESEVVGFLLPLSTFDASVEILLDDCFFTI